MPKKNFNASVLPKMRTFTSKLITRKDCVLVGLSGGADSVCLLHFLQYLAKEKHFALAAVHINHGLRGAHADADEPGAGMHGVATATVAALFGMECEVFMGEVDVARQAPNVERMHALGAKVRSIKEGSRTLKDAMNAALREWTATSKETFYLIGTAAGPYPYPMIVKDFQSVIGRETRKQCLERCGRLPDEVVACVGGGSNAIGMFAGFLDDPAVKLVGAEAGGLGIESGKHAASINGGRVGILHGMKAYFLQDKNGQMLDTHSVSAGLDYSGVGPEHCFLADTKRARYTVVTDEEAVAAFDLLCRLEGIIPALESSHAVAQAVKDAAELGRGRIIVVNLSGRGDKDMDNIKQYKVNHGQNL